MKRIKKSHSKSLQKLTESEERINTVLNLDSITFKDLRVLNKEEKDRLFVLITDKLNSLKDVERDKYLKKIEEVTCEETRNQLWEYNHIKITWAISTLMQDYGRMPSKSEIAKMTELSRQTIHKHLREYESHPLYIDQVEQYKFMSGKILSKLFSFAVNGDVAAAKLYLTFTGCPIEPIQNSTLIKNQNNFIQINNTIISQQEIKNLTPNQLNDLETFIKNKLISIMSTSI